MVGWREKAERPPGSDPDGLGGGSDVLRRLRPEVSGGALGAATGGLTYGAGQALGDTSGFWGTSTGGDTSGAISSAPLTTGTEGGNAVVNTSPVANTDVSSLTNTGVQSIAGTANQITSGLLCV